VKVLLLLLYKYKYRTHTPDKIVQYSERSELLSIIEGPLYTCTNKSVRGTTKFRCFSSIHSNTQQKLYLRMLGSFSTMSQPVTIPIFGSNSTQHPQQAGEQQQDGSASGWYPPMDDGGDQDMDFDLLAEYLLEENPTVNQSEGVSFDFNNEFVVSPEQSVDGRGDNGAAQARDIITQHAATIATTVTSNPASATTTTVASTNQPQRLQQQRVMYAPVAAPPLLVAPSAPPQLAAQGMAVPRTITQYSSQPAMAPVPVMSYAAASTVRRTTTTKAPKTGGATAEAKRRRINPPEVAAQGLINASYLTNPANMSPAVVAAAAAAAAMQGRGRKKTQAQIDRRRERNRILARRTRLRKKFFFESLQKEVMELQRDNAALRDIVRTEVEGDEGRKLLEQCNAARQLPREVLEACGGENPDLDTEDFNLITSIQQSQHSFVITDPSLQDNPNCFCIRRLFNIDRLFKRRCSWSELSIFARGAD